MIIICIIALYIQFLLTPEMRSIPQSNELRYDVKQWSLKSDTDQQHQHYLGTFKNTNSQVGPSSDLNWKL